MIVISVLNSQRIVCKNIVTHRGSDKTITGPRHMVTWSDIVEAGNILIDLRNDTMSVYCFGSGSSQIMNWCMYVINVFYAGASLNVLYTQDSTAKYSTDETGKILDD